MNKIKTKLDYLYLPCVYEDINIIHISDIHFNTNITAKKLKSISSYIANLNPSYIMITGDLIDIPEIVLNKEKIKELIDFLLELGKISKVIVGLGNHDIVCYEDFTFFKEIDRLPNIYVLNNQAYQDKYIYVTGFTLPHDYYYNITRHESVKILNNYLNEHSKLISDLPEKLPKIALIHSPINLTEDRIFNKLKRYNLILSGHTHGGMVPDGLRFLFKDNRGIVAPNKKFFPKIAKGKIVKCNDNGETTIIINEAITKLSLLSGKSLHRFNFVYNANINKIIIRKKERDENE